MPTHPTAEMSLTASGLVDDAFLQTAVKGVEEVSGVTVCVRVAREADGGEPEQIRVCASITAPAHCDVIVCTQAVATFSRDRDLGRAVYPFAELLVCEKDSERKGGVNVIGEWEKDFLQPFAGCSLKLSFTVKINRIDHEPQSSLVSCRLAVAKLQLQGKIIEARAPLLAAWSDYFDGLFGGVESCEEAGEGGEEEVFLIEDCPPEDMQELLAVIGPSGKPIDCDNLTALLAMADRFAMSQLTRRCEVFMCASGCADPRDPAAILELADYYGLCSTRMVTLARLSADAITALSQDEVHDSFSEEMKMEMRERHAELCSLLEGSN